MTRLAPATSPKRGTHDTSTVAPAEPEGAVHTVSTVPPSPLGNDIENSTGKPSSPSSVALIPVMFTTGTPAPWLSRDQPEPMVARGRSKPSPTESSIRSPRPSVGMPLGRSEGRSLGSSVGKSDGCL